MIEIKANAKLNLYLDITGKLDNGYHTLEMIMQSINLHDTLRIYEDVGFEVICEGIPMEKNIAYQAGMAFYEETGIMKTARIEIEKNIPSQAGMGGGSADAAATLFGLNKLYGFPLQMPKLKELAIKLGADVPFSLTGGCMTAHGIGEDLTSIRNNMNCFYLIAKPEAGCSTPKAYSLYDYCPINPPNDSFNRTKKAVIDGNIHDFCLNTFNALEQSAIKLCPQISSLLDSISSSEGCSGSLMTGSGSACVGIFTDISSALLAKINLVKKFPNLKTYIAKPSQFGIQLQ